MLMDGVKLFCTAACPRCEMVKKALEKIGIEYDVVGMATSEGLTELRVAGVFTLSAPVLQVGDDFYTVDDLFDGDNLRPQDASGRPQR